MTYRSGDETSPLQQPHNPKGQTATWHVAIKCPTCQEVGRRVATVEARLWVEAMTSAERQTGIPREYLSLEVAGG